MAKMAIKGKQRQELARNGKKWQKTARQCKKIQENGTKKGKNRHETGRNGKNCNFQPISSFFILWSGLVWSTFENEGPELYLRHPSKLDNFLRRTM